MEDMQADATKRFGFEPRAEDEIGPRITMELNRQRLLPKSKASHGKLHSIPLGLDNDDPSGFAKIIQFVGADNTASPHYTTVSIDEEAHLRIELSRGFSLSDVTLHQRSVEQYAKNERETEIMREAVRKNIWICLFHGPLSWPFQYIGGKKFDPDKTQRSGEFVHSSEVDPAVRDRLYFRELDTRKKVERIFKVLTFEDIDVLLKKNK
jgi:hypothetical protein